MTVDREIRFIAMMEIKVPLKLADLTCMLIERSEGLVTIQGR